MALVPFSRHYKLYLTSITVARDVWDVTGAADLIGSWTNTSSLSDCPDYQPFQIGAFNFETTTDCLNKVVWQIQDNDLAYVDWPLAGCTGGLCGSMSISVNLKHTFVANGSPSTGEYDLRAVLAHEFGHVLGLHHLYLGECSDVPLNSCASGFATRETMSIGMSPGAGENCQATLETGDTANADHFYP